MGWTGEVWRWIFFSHGFQLGFTFKTIVKALDRDLHFVQCYIWGNTPTFCVLVIVSNLLWIMTLHFLAQCPKGYSPYYKLCYSIVGLCKVNYLFLIPAHICMSPACTSDIWISTTDVIIWGCDPVMIACTLACLLTCKIKASTRSP